MIMATWFVGDQAQEIWPVQWGHITQNKFFAPGQVGMWVAPDGSYTWQDATGDGPTHWRMPK